MTKDIIILILFLTILFLTHKTSKKKIRNLFYKSKIKQIDISELDKIFDEKLISKNLKGPSWSKKKILESKIKKVKEKKLKNNNKDTVSKNPPNIISRERFLLKLSSYSF